MKVELKNVMRCLFYSLLAVFIFFSGVLIAKPAKIGSKVWLCAWAYTDIFHEVPFERVKDFLCWQASQRVWVSFNFDDSFTVLDVTNDGEQTFFVSYTIKNEKGETITDVERVFIQWKPWSYGLSDPPVTAEEIAEMFYTKGVTSD
jgi:hypothetical protein